MTGRDFPFQLSKGQYRRWKRYGKMPAFLQVADRQVSSRPLNRPPRDGPKAVNPAEQMWSDFTFSELST